MQYLSTKIIILFLIPNLHPTTPSIPILVWGIWTENNGFLFRKCSFWEGEKWTKKCYLHISEKTVTGRVLPSEKWQNSLKTCPAHCTDTSAKAYLHDTQHKTFLKISSSTVSVLCNMKGYERWKQSARKFCSFCIKYADNIIDNCFPAQFCSP